MTRVLAGVLVALVVLLVVAVVKWTQLVDLMREMS